MSQQELPVTDVMNLARVFRCTDRTIHHMQKVMHGDPYSLEQILHFVGRQYITEDELRQLLFDAYFNDNETFFRSSQLRKMTGASQQACFNSALPRIFLYDGAHALFCVTGLRQMLVPIARHEGMHIDALLQDVISGRRRLGRTAEMAKAHNIPTRKLSDHCDKYGHAYFPRKPRENLGERIWLLPEGV